MKGSIKRGRVTGTFYLRVELDRGANGERRRMRETFRGSRRDADARLRDLLRDKESGGLDGARVTVRELCERWLEAVEHRVAGHTSSGIISSSLITLYPSLADCGYASCAPPESKPLSLNGSRRNVPMRSVCFPLAL